ncbi:MAG: PIN domain-containing protein [Algisphaera sp.]
MRTILDTNVISELRLTQPNPTVLEKVRAIGSRNLYLTSITFSELAHGVYLLDEGKKKRELLSWLDGLEHHYHSRILPFDHETGVIWGRCMADMRRRGIVISREDAQIAAIALRFDMPVFSRDVMPFEAMGVVVTNPWGI